MHALSDSTTLADIVAADFRAAAVLDRFGLDFCCGGKRTLDEACAAKKLDAGAVAAALGALDPTSGGGAAAPDVNWRPDALARHIVERHHGYVRAQTPVIAARLAKLVSVHGERHKELAAVAAHFAEVAAELQTHMIKEEQILFPYIAALAAAADGGSAPPPNPFGTVRNPIRMMEMEHQSAGGELATIRELTGDYTVPEDGCATYRVCYAELADFDRDLRRHIHLENNVLFPKAVQLEGMEI
jgi:regulator of cell morphogenesis and NO signaling